MTLTYPQAVDEIFGQFHNEWLASSAAIAGYVPHIYWKGVEEPEKIDGSAYFVRASQQTVAEGQGSLTTQIGATTKRRWRTVGLVVIQIFCPRSDVQGMERGRLLAELARNCFRGQATENGVWFRNARIIEQPPEELFNRFNIVAEYEYDEVDALH